MRLQAKVGLRRKVLYARLYRCVGKEEDQQRGLVLVAGTNKIQ